jgi:hypothetical protein
LLTAIAAFAEAFVNPLAPLLVLAAALFLRRRWLVHAIAAVVGCLLGILANLELGPGDLVLAMLGAILALLLHTEIALYLVLPALRWLRHCAATTWELGWLMLAMMSRLWARSPPQIPSPPDKDPGR